jgi:hypothetical protein
VYIDAQIAKAQHLADPSAKRAMGFKPSYQKPGPDLATRQAALTSESMDLPDPNPRQYLCEKMSYKQLVAYSTPARKERAKNVRGPSLKLETSADSNFYHFNFRSYPSTEKHRHVGYVRFLKPANPNTPLSDVNCVVDCTCKDMRYRWAWANKQREAGIVGPGSYNKAWNRAPRITNPRGRPGLCKHVLAVGAYLGDLVYKMPDKLSAPERLGKLVTLTNRSVINPPKEAPENKPPIAGKAPFRASPIQRSIPTIPTRGREELRKSPLTSLRQAERDRARAVEKEVLDRNLPTPQELEAERRRKLRTSAWRPEPRREDVLTVRCNMTKGKLLQEAEDELSTMVAPEKAAKPEDGTGEEAPAQMETADFMELLKQISELLVGFLGTAETDLTGEGDFKLPDGAVKLDLATGEESDDPQGAAKQDIEDTSPEGVGGAPDEEDARS